MSLLAPLWLLAIAACGASVPEPARGGADVAAVRSAEDVIRRWEGGAALRTFVDPARGILVLRYCGSLSESDPECQASAYLHCGDSLTRASAVLQDDLEMRQNYGGALRVYRCNGNACRHSPMMDGDHEGILRVSQTRPIVIVEVLHIVGRLRGDQENALESWVEEQRQQNSTGCGEQRR